MFGPWSNFASEDRSEKERPPPDQPIPLQWPHYTPKPQSNPLTSSHLNHVKRQIINIKTPFHIRPHQIESLNIAYTPNVSLSDLIPSTANPAAKQAELASILNDELLLPNDLCYRKIIRLSPPKGQAAPKLSNTYSFYQGLECMSQYWDTSEDNYYTIPVEPGSPTNLVSKVLPSTTPQTRLPAPTPTPKKVYKGRRIGSGAQMPAVYREQALLGFATIVTGRFGCTSKKPPRGPILLPRLRVDNLLVPVKHTYIIGKFPADRLAARRGVIEGPVMLLQSREETKFRKDRESLGCGTGEVLDFWRELGALLALAQLRRREGRRESVPGEGQWWARKPRWGGGRGGKMAHEVPLKENMLYPAPSLAHPLHKTNKSTDVADGKQKGQQPASSSSSKDELVLKIATSSLLEADTTALLSLSSSSNNLNLNLPTPISNTASKALISITPQKRPISTVTISPPPAAAKPTHKPGDGMDSAPPSPPFRQPRNPQADAWRDMTAPKGVWDKNVMYRSIGKPTCQKSGAGEEGMRGGEGQAGWDHVYSLSCVNHHLCILRLRVHDSYLAWLENENTNDRAGNGESARDEDGGGGNDGGLKQNILYVERSRWFDLFIPEERAEACSGLWRVMAWLCRDEKR